MSSSYESAARLLWDPGRWSSPDLDLISTLSSLSIASSFHDDLHVEEPSFPLLIPSAAASVLAPAIPQPLMDAVPSRVMPVVPLSLHASRIAPSNRISLGAYLSMWWPCGTGAQLAATQCSAMRSYFVWCLL